MQPIPEVFTTTITAQVTDKAGVVTPEADHSFEAILSEADMAQAQTSLTGGATPQRKDWIEDAIFAIGVLTETEFVPARPVAQPTGIVATPILSAGVSGTADVTPPDISDGLPLPDATQIKAPIVRSEQAADAPPRAVIAGPLDAAVPAKPEALMPKNVSSEAVKAGTVHEHQARPEILAARVPKQNRTGFLEQAPFPQAATDGKIPLKGIDLKVQAPIDAAPQPKVDWAFHSQRPETGPLDKGVSSSVRSAPDPVAHVQPALPQGVPGLSSMSPIPSAGTSNNAQITNTSKAQMTHQQPETEMAEVSVQARPIRKEEGFVSKSPPPEPEPLPNTPAPQKTGPVASTGGTFQVSALPNPPAVPVPTPPSLPSLAVDRLSDVEGLSMVDYGLSEADKLIADPVRAKPELPAPALARQISQQLIEALRTHTERPIEVTLSPEELGRVKLSLAAGETGITVHVLADRPETADLLRRHIDVLSEDFRSLGYEDINFSFGSDDSDPQMGASGQGPSGSAETPDDIAETVTPVTIHLDQSDGLDIRL